MSARLGLENPCYRLRGECARGGTVSCRGMVIFGRHGGHPCEALAIHDQCHPVDTNCTQVNLSCLSRIKTVRCVTSSLARMPR